MDHRQTLSGHEVFKTKSLTPISRSFLFTELFGLDPVEKYRRKLRQESRQEGRREERQKIFKAIESAYPEVDIEIIRAALEDQNKSAGNSK